jgi:hypothetical protein
MDPRDRADALLARARARGSQIVTPDNMTSPMDSASTQQIPRTMVNAIDPRELDPESTMVISAQMAAGGWPRPQQQQHQAPQQQHQQHGPQQQQQQAPQQHAPQQQVQHQQQPQQQYQQQSPQQYQQQHQSEPAQQRVAPGPLPTVQQVPNGRPSLTQRLSPEPQKPPGLAQRLNGEA